MNPYWDNGIVQIIQGDCREVLAQMEPDSVDCVVTSPPYWGLRDYGLEPSVWDAVGGCRHEWGQQRIVKRGHPGELSTLVGTQTAEISKAAGNQGSFCRHCGAWRGTLGLEPTPELYTQHLVEIFREVRRVLKLTGSCWVNLGDSYAATQSFSAHHNVRSGLAAAANRVDGGNGGQVSESLEQQQSRTVPMAEPISLFQGDRPLLEYPC